jgi:hypothetical protein
VEENHSSDVEVAQELEALEVEHLKTALEEDPSSGPAAAAREGHIEDDHAAAMS